MLNVVLCAVPAYVLAGIGSATAFGAPATTRTMTTTTAVTADIAIRPAQVHDSMDPPRIAATISRISR